MTTLSGIGTVMVHVPTVFLLIVLLSLSLGGAIRLVSSTEPESGLNELAHGLIAHGIAYLLFLMSPWTGAIGIWVAEVCVGLFFVLCLRALDLFHRRRTSKALGPTILAAVAVSSAIFVGDTERRILANDAVLILVQSLVLHRMWISRGSTTGRGRHLVAAATALGLVIMLHREWVILTGGARVEAIFDQNVSQSVIYSAAIVGLVLFSVGFVLMSKERTDAANREMILKDKLTGIWNRRKLEEVGQVELRRLVRHGTPVSLMLIDLDDFKRINDRFGHAAGDAVLRRVAEVCGQWLRETDVFGRWGGEEFMVVLPGTGVDESLRLAEDLRRAVHAVDAGIGRQISISIGVSLCLSGDDWRSWFERTDAALYRAKSAGKNCSFFEIPLERVAGALQIRWTEDMKVGIDEVDADHAALIAINNDLLRFMNDTYDKRLVYERLREVERRMTAHTEREERLIDRWMPGRLAAHAAEHRALGDRFRFLVERFEADTVPLEALAQFLVFEMCAQHINLYDREVFRDFPAVAAAGFRASAEAGPVDRLETV